MDELERTVVQIAEAKRLATPGDVPHGRLALLLLDNAAEMSLMRTARTNIEHAEMYNNLLYQLQTASLDDEGRKLKSRIEAETISKKRRRQIEYNYEALVDYVFERDKFPLSVEYATCLKILHRYRNAAYHRDVVRADVLGPAVQILFFLCCHLLKNEQEFMHQIEQVPTGILDILDGNLPASDWPANSFDTRTLARHVADYFLAELELDHSGIEEALSNHLLARLDALVADLDEIAEYTPPGITRWATLRLVQQAPQEPKDFDSNPPKDFWTRPLPVTEELIENWFQGARSLREISIAPDALRAFASIEQPLEAIEEPVGRFIMGIDREVQLRIDEMRGK